MAPGKIRNCKECFNFTSIKSCKVEDDALDRIKRRRRLPMDLVKKQYFTTMLDLFIQMNDSDDDDFYGKHCIFFMTKD